MRNGAWEAADSGGGLAMMTFSYLLLACLPCPRKQTDAVQATKNQPTWGREEKKERAGMHLQSMSSRFCGVQQAQKLPRPAGPCCQAWWN